MEPLLTNREVQIHPGELLSLIHDDQLNLVMLDVRDENDYNLFHIPDAQRIPLDGVAVQVAWLLTEPENTVVVVMSNGEVHASEAWKTLVAESVPNVYILEGGLNYWLDIFGGQGGDLRLAAPISGDETLRHTFDAALGSKHPASEPDPDAFDLEYTPKLKLERDQAPSGGGCG
jgi:rhodanese-related sulfurtransferase